MAYDWHYFLNVQKPYRSQVQAQIKEDLVAAAAAADRDPSLTLK